MGVRLIFSPRMPWGDSLQGESCRFRFAVAAKNGVKNCFLGAAMTKKGKADLLQGTLDMLILKCLGSGAQHGYGVAKWIQLTTNDSLSVEEGSLYPALHRMQRRGWLSSEWGVSESNRRAKYYQLTRAGRAQLKKEVKAWENLVGAISLILNAKLVEVSQ